MFFTAIVLYGNVLFIFPKFYKEKQNSFFLLISTVFILANSFLFAYSDYAIMEYYDINPKHDFKNPFIPLFIRSLFWSVLIYLGSTIYMLQDQLRKRSEESKRIVEEKLKTELKFLKAQINPHFLFNALNNIYSLSYLKSDKGPDAVLKLSGMLRYVIEDCQEDIVSLNSEIEYIENFINFQQMKSKDTQNIVFEHDLVSGTEMVAPMLFVSFIENSFKYSKIENAEGAFVKMKLDKTGNQIIFSIENSIPEKGKATPGSGKGIENTRQRLNILYPEKHKIKIAGYQNTFKVELKIECS
jgi:two-component system LytT family sensor kinase